MRPWCDGWRRVISAPAVIAGVVLVTLLAALPLALTLRGALRDHLGSSLAANDAADGVNYDWWQEFTSQASGIGTTFTPSIIGFATTLDNVSGLLDRRTLITPIASALGIYVGAWMLLTGGIIDRYARGRRVGAHGFFAASGTFFFRFLRLGAGAAVVYDYAKVRAVVEDRRSMIGALIAAMRFIVRHPGRVAGVYALNAALWLAIVAIWAIVAPGAGGSGASMWVGFAASQGYIVARLVVKLQGLASETAVFQRSLAHWGYAAAPAFVPPAPAIVDARAVSASR